MKEIFRRRGIASSGLALMLAAAAGGPALASPDPAPPPGTKKTVRATPRPAAKPAPDVLPAADAEGWRALPSKGTRGLELTLAGRSRVRVRSIREGDGRFRFLPLTESAGDAGAGGKSASDQKPAFDAKAAAAIPIDFEKTGGLMFLGLGGPPETPDPPVVAELDLPSKVALTLILGNSDVTMSGDPVAIPDELEPYAPPPPRQPPPPPGTARPTSSSAAPPEVSADQPPKVAGGIGGPISIQGDSGSVKLQDLLQNVSIEWKKGNLSLARLAGSVKIQGENQVEATGLGGILSIAGTAGIRARALRAAADIRDAKGTVEIHGLAGDLHLALRGGDGDIEDARGKVDANVGEGELTLSTVYALATVTLAGGTLNADRLQLGLTANGSWNGIRLREINGPVNLKGDGSSAEVEQSGGPVTVRGDVRDVRVRDVQTDIVLQLRGGDATIDRVGGRVTINTDGGRAAITDVTRQLQVSADWIEASVTGQMEASAEYSFKGVKSVQLDLPDGKYDLRIRSDGEVESDFPFEKTPQQAMVQQADAQAAQAQAGQAPGQSGLPPPPPGTTPPRPQPPRNPAQRTGQKVTIDCAGDVEVRKR